jgi:hypothetical protein
VIELKSPSFPTGRFVRSRCGRSLVGGVVANVIQVVPLTSTLPSFGSEGPLKADAQNGLDADSSAQCQTHSIGVNSESRTVKGNIGSAALSEIRQVLGLILDID